jgi:endonuclease/exonuclease/phosphatase family metal-dependent hydrolase
MKLRVLTYNIHRAIGVDRSFRPRRVAEILAHHDADLVLLQEVDDGVPRSGHLDLARELAEELDYPYRAVGHNVSLRKGRYGNATLSRYPIERERNIDLTIGRKKRRGCQHTTLRVEKVRGHPHILEVFNLHLGLSARERQQQVGLLASSSEFSKLDHDRACIVGGDFNDWRSLLRRFFVEVLDFDCATESVTRNGRSPLRTYPSFSPRGPLDRLYFRGSLKRRMARRCRLRVSKVASDHLPIIVEFELH